MAAINVGKSLIMCHHAASCLSQGKNVLYITLEMSENQIRERIDANLLDVTTDDLMTLTKEEYMGRVNQIKLKTSGKLFVKEFPTAGAHVGHFKASVAEMKIKKGVVPDIIFIDYINICAGQRLKTSENTNAYIKAIAEEVRGMAMEMNIPIVSATQLTREGMQSSDPDMTDVAEAISLPQTADLFLSITENEELEEMGQYLFKQLKNRLNKKNNPKRFMVGVDKDKLRLYNLDADAQKHLIKDNSKPAKGAARQQQTNYSLPAQNDGNKRAGLKRIKVT
jgi:replicative DNA helicase